MRKVEKEIAEQLWAHVADQFVGAVRAYVEVGVARQKGKSAKEMKTEALVELVKLAYQAGLDRGYDMGAEVFGDRDDRSDQ